MQEIDDEAFTYESRSMNFLPNFKNRYDKLNDPLNKIINGNPDEELTQDEKSFYLII